MNDLTRVLTLEFDRNFSPDTLITLALLNLPGIGRARYWSLMAKFGSLQSLLNKPTEQLSGLLSSRALSLWQHFCDNPAASRLGQEVQRQLEKVEASGCELMSCGCDNYPLLLREIAQPPPLLYLKGDLSCLELPQIAVVGSRKPTPVGVANAENFAGFLAGRGFAITSGLAVGIDASAHRGALAVGGKTLAVLGTGLDIIYPRSHRQLAEEIIATGGLLVSEFAMGTSARPGNFPQRNRIISGLSLGILVVEAAEKSGSLISARLAQEQGREVFALPGSIHCPVSRGCHDLIRQGATLVQSAQQMVDELAGLLALKSQQLSLLPEAVVDPQSILPARPAASELTGESQRQLLAAMGYELVDIDTLVERLGWSPDKLLAELVTLELSGLIYQCAGGYQRGTS